MMKSICKKNVKVLISAWFGSLVMFLLVYILVLMPQQNIKKQSREVLNEKERLYSSAVKASQENARIRLKEQSVALSDKLMAFVVDFEDSADLIFDISQIANETEVASFSIKARDARQRKKAGFDYISEDQIDIQFTADFNKFISLLNSLERFKPIILIDRFHIIRSKAEGSNHDASVSLAVFVKKQQESKEHLSSI